MTDFVVRNHTASDIPLYVDYWASLTDADLQRMSIMREKMPTAAQLTARLTQLLETPVAERQTDPLVWQWQGRPIGFTNLNALVPKEQGEIHLHMPVADLRGKGLGRRFFMMSVRAYLTRHSLKRVVCQPASANLYPNAMLRALGIPINSTYVTVPSIICVEHEVNRYEITSEEVDHILARWK